jgi:membrane protease YdiL (CAAX protease family)
VTSFHLEGAEEEFPPPWGFWSTAGWTLLAFGLAVLAVSGWVFCLNWGQLEATPDPQHDTSFTLQLILLNAVQLGVLAVAARLAGWPVGRYLGLVAPRRGDVLYAIAAVALLLGALEILTHVLDRDSVTPFQGETYRTARAAGVLAMLWLAFVVAAPLGEEITFRGFMFRGWAASPLGAPGTILVTSLIFSALHTQYDWFGTLQTFCMGALLGWLRWRSGSTILTIGLHMAINLVSTLWTAAKAQALV